MCRAQPPHQAVSCTHHKQHVHTPHVQALDDLPANRAQGHTGTTRVLADTPTSVDKGSQDSSVCPASVENLQCTCTVYAEHSCNKEMQGRLLAEAMGDAEGCLLTLCWLHPCLCPGWCLPAAGCHQRCASSMELACSAVQRSKKSAARHMICGNDDTE